MKTRYIYNPTPSRNITSSTVTQAAALIRPILPIRPIFTLAAFLLTLAPAIHAQSIDTASTYTAISQSAHQRVMRRVISGTEADGSTVLRTNTYVEIATGLSFLSNGVWAASSSAISIAADGGEATNLQSRVHFNANINSSNAIHLVTPDGQHLRSNPLFIAYFDGTNSSVIGEVTNSIGQVLSSASLLYSATSSTTNGASSMSPANNAVLFTNAFYGLSADLCYHVGLGNFEQDVILRQQLPPPPDTLGPNLRLQVWTEFSESPTPQINSETNATVGLVDQTLNFSGTMEMGPGHAFVAGDGTPLTPTFKRWLNISGRNFLVEEIPLSAIATELENLPPYTGSTYTPSSSSPQVARANIAPTLPPRRLAATKATPLLLAKAPLFKHGLVLDYNTIVSTLTNVTFQSDTTYFVSGTLDLYGTTTIEGGTVIKTGATNGGTTIHSNLICLTAPYRMAIITSMHDDTAGQQISGSTGNNNLIVTTPLQWNLSGSISNIRFSYTFNAFSANSPNVDVWDCQFVNCTHPITANSGTTNLGLHNVLICQTNTVNTNGLAFTLYSTALTIRGEHVTADLGPASFVGFTSSQLSYFDLTNSLIQATNLLHCTSGSPSVTVNTNSVYYSSVPNSGLFQSVGAGNYYLANNSPYRAAGTTNLSAATLADLALRTTYPPVTLSNVTFTADTILSPEAQRDNTGTLDYGFHYTPADFIGYCAITNANLLLTNGVAFAYYGGGIWPQNGSQLLSQGTPNTQNYLVYYNAIQEQSLNLLSGYIPANAVNVATAINPYQPTVTVNPNVYLRFTTIASPQGAATVLPIDYTATSSTWAINNLTLRDCEIYCAGGEFQLKQTSGSANTGTTIWLENNLFHRPNFQAWSTAQLTTYNNLFTGTNNTVEFLISGTPAWTNFNNAFDGVSATVLNSSFLTNAYLNGAAYGTLRGGDTVATLAWVTGPLGNYYQPTTSPLITNGNTYAANIGLYHYTVTTNQVPDATNRVSLAYHYVALGTNGLPLSTSGDGIGDYLKDSNGNGIYDVGDLGNWTTNSICGSGANDYLKWLQGINLNVCNIGSDTNGIIGLQVYTPLK